MKAIRKIAEIAREILQLDKIERLERECRRGGRYSEAVNHYKCKSCNINEEGKK